MLNGHIDPTFLYTCAKPQPHATSTSHVTAKYVPEQTFPLNWAHMPHRLNI